MNDVARVLSVIKMSMKDDDRSKRKDFLLTICYYFVRRMLQQIPIVKIRRDLCESINKL